MNCERIDGGAKRTCYDLSRAEAAYRAQMDFVINNVVFWIIDSVFLVAIEAQLRLMA
jgi:hypothetical protein